METFTFADPAIWGNDRLVDRLRTLQAVEPMHQNPNDARKLEIARELTNIAFEYGQRAKEQSMPVAKLPEAIYGD